eukprot:TRINITY_DN18472_c0_g1_i1.p1 TRINITY_DN18472_c0_g1~~TRINITY_DN18472_c0_g1_i1.p1  ORF type:complete len:357 (-),score=49.70 TRINITY_DN18472_c0_g1_i1:902-1972(-)
MNEYHEAADQHGFLNILEVCARVNRLPQEAWALNKQVRDCVKVSCSCRAWIDAVYTPAAVQQAFAQARQIKCYMLSGDFGPDPISLPPQLQHLHFSTSFRGRLGAVPRGLISLRVLSGAHSQLGDIMPCMPGTLKRVTIEGDGLYTEWDLLGLWDEDDDEDEDDDDDDNDEEEDYSSDSASENEQDYGEELAHSEAVQPPWPASPIAADAEEGDMLEEGVQAAAGPPAQAAAALLPQEAVIGDTVRSASLQVLGVAQLWPQGVTELAVCNNFDPRPWPPCLQSLEIWFVKPARYYQGLQTPNPSAPAWFPTLLLPSSLHSLLVHISQLIHYDVACISGHPARASSGGGVLGSWGRR